MSQHIRSSASAARGRSALVAALLAGAGWVTPGAAAEVGHSRLVSGPGAPLQVVVPLQRVSPDEVESLRAAIAPESAWAQSRMEPPVPLAGLRVRIEQGATASQRLLRVYADTPAPGPVIDLLLDIATASGKRRIQLSFLASAATLPTQAPPVIESPAAASPTRITVQRGDTLFAIAQRHGVPQASVFQMLVALWQANPKAFIGNNMNLVRAGSALELPDAATVRAIDPRQARQIYLQQVEAFQRARAGRAAGAAAASGSASGAVSEADAPATLAATAGVDRVRLSAAQDAQADERISLDRQVNETGARVAELEGNVDSLAQATAGVGGGAAGGHAGSDARATQAGGAQTSAQSDGQAAQPQGRSAGQAGAGSTSPPTPGPQGGASTSSQPSREARADRAVAADASPANPSGSDGVDGQGAGSTQSPAPSATAQGGANGSRASGGSASSAAGGTGSPGLGPAVQGPSAAVGTAPGAEADEAAGSWWSNNLLVVVTGILAIIAFIIAWAMRRAGARQDDDSGDDELYEERDHGRAQAIFQEKLQSIDLELDEDGRRWRQR